ncbi:MAG: glycoside hydrolase family 43 protein [Roseburia sp.]
MRKNAVFLGWILILTTFFTGCGNMTKNEISVDEVKKATVEAGAAIHDPQLLVGEDGKYYLFGTHMMAGKSEDLIHWDSFAEGVDKGNKLFDNLFDEEKTAFSYVGKNEEGGYSVWAPNVIYNKAMEKYVMYFCTTSSYIKSNICFATAEKPEGPYTYQDTILYSGFTSQTVKNTNFYEVMGENTKITDYVKNGGFNNIDWPNCIDPAVFYDEDGKMWMVYGSWSGGIFLLELDEKTGQPIHPETDETNNVNKYYGKRLVGGGHNSIEGPYIQYNEKNGYYYLLVSYGALNREGGYQIREFRSKTVDGIYVDAKGQEMQKVLDHTEYGVKMMGNYKFPSMDRGYMAPGGQSAFTDTDGKMYVVYHQRFDEKTEEHEPRVHQLFTNEDDWLVAAPFATMGETLSEKGYHKKDITGTYYILNHGKAISSKLKNAKETTLYANGTIKGDYEGTFEIADGSNNITVSIDGVDYKGVIIEMDDEAGNPVLCFSAVGDNNETIWGVHYLKNHTVSYANRK